MKAALIVDSDGSITEWQSLALEQAVSEDLEIVLVLHEVGAGRLPRRPENALYFALALSCRPWVHSNRKADPSRHLSANVRHICFNADWEGMWQRIPPDVTEELQGLDVVIKFGMGLLKDPESLPISFGVLSYHHGDPRAFRGRPAGFWEMQAKESVVGVIVQRLTNELDGGDVLAKAYSNVVRHSYAQTLENAYRAGIPLLRHALSSSEVDTPPDPGAKGPINRLPSNRQVAGAMLTSTTAKCRRLIYGLLRQKRWTVGMLQRPIEMRGETIIGQQDLIMLPVPPKHVFVADPCGTLEKSVYCEVLSQWSGKGRIARWNDGHWTSVDLGKGGMHSSYPQIVRDGRRSYIFPEISSGSPPTLFQLGSDGITVTATRELEGLEGTRLVDATLFHVGAMWYLFGGHHDSANYQLQLWTASRLTGPYQPHPRSPICLDPRGARMAGPLVTLGRQAFRFGQDGSVKYGGRVLVHRIDALTREEYKESVCGSIEVAGAWGPHTVNMTPQGTWIDLYREVWAPLAWLRRVQAKASR